MSTMYEGSPPPMRGKVRNLNEVCKYTGITPAYAGKSLLPDFLFLANRDHPRLCGEKLVRGRLWKRKLGSPPPMRGKD